MPCGFVFFCRSGWRCGELCVECNFTALAVVYIAEEIKVVVEEVCPLLVFRVDLDAAEFT